MTLADIQKEFENLDWDFRNVPNRQQAVDHEKQIVINFLIALEDKKVKVSDSSLIAREILTRKRFI